MEQFVVNSHFLGIYIEISAFSRVKWSWMAKIIFETLW